MMTTPVIEASTHRSHPLHGDAATWPETNCYVDLFVELLHGMRLDPVAGLGFVLGVDFDGDQWEFFKFPHDDLRALYGIEVREMNAWRPLVDHVEQHLELGHFLTIEADSWYLPDTEGVSYRLGHQKTTIAPVAIDVPARRVTYVHNRGCYELEGGDFDAVMRVDAPAEVLPPYVEIVDVSTLVSHDPVELREFARALAAEHAERAPDTNPVRRLRDRVVGDLGWLQSQDPEVFHHYAFGTLRQMGAWASSAATFAEWLGSADYAAASTEFTEISESAKTAQFLLARAARGRASDLDSTFDQMSAAWERAYDSIRGVAG